MGFRVEIDSETCVSSGKCVADHPDSFGFDDDELAVVQTGAARLDDAALLKAARRCPSGAILLLDAEGNCVEL